MTCLKAAAGRYGIKTNSTAVPNRARKLIKAMTLRQPLSVAKHVLVVDDDAAVRKSIKFALELEGFEVRDFSSAEELLIQESIPPRSCLVVDYYMPEMNGLELVAKLRERDSALPVVLITGSDDNLRNRAAALGVIMVDKPMLGAPLLNAVRSAFGGEATSS
ncbi:response regulator [Bradyrhizobium septentrionale]|uniref:Response regulator n=1 Tax=Bradyrhizobium septentrionale TaxID=1404411 RepID=A0ABZ2P516_9BRAD